MKLRNNSKSGQKIIENIKNKTNNNGMKKP